MKKHIASEAGMTLVEVLVALVILTTAVVSLTAGMATLAAGTDRHRKTVTADTVARRKAEEIKLAVKEASASSWCVATGTTTVDGYTVVVEPRTTPSSCVSATSAIQQIRITASNDRAQAQLIETVRKP